MRLLPRKYVFQGFLADQLDGPYRLPIPMLWKTRRITDKMARNLWIAYILSIPLKSFSKSRDRVANIKVHDKVVKARPGVTKFVMPVANQT